VTDGQSDGHRATAKTALASHCKKSAAASQWFKILTDYGLIPYETNVKSKVPTSTQEKIQGFTRTFSDPFPVFSRTYLHILGLQRKHRTK